MLFDMGQKEEEREERTEEREPSFFENPPHSRVRRWAERNNRRPFFMGVCHRTREKKEEKGNAFSGETPVGKLQLHSGEEEEEEATAEAEAAVTDR